MGDRPPPYPDGEPYPEEVIEQQFRNKLYLLRIILVV
jgi:hypothetical protein